VHGLGTDGDGLAGVGGDTLRSMDALRRDDVERARATSPEEKARQAFDAMRTGIRLKRAALRERDPAASPEEIEQRLQRWLERDE
jgi:hypothetical protein